MQLIHAHQTLRTGPPVLRLRLERREQSRNRQRRPQRIHQLFPPAGGHCLKQKSSLSPAACNPLQRRRHNYQIHRRGLNRVVFPLPARPRFSEQIQQPFLQFVIADQTFLNIKSAQQTHPQRLIPARQRLQRKQFNESGNDDPCNPRRCNERRRHQHHGHRPVPPASHPPHAVRHKQTKRSQLPHRGQPRLPAQQRPECPGFPLPLRRRFFFITEAPLRNKQRRHRNVNQQLHASFRSLPDHWQPLPLAPRVILPRPYVVRQITHHGADPNRQSAQPDSQLGQPVVMQPRMLLLFF